MCCWRYSYSRLRSGRKSFLLRQRRGGGRVVVATTESASTNVLVLPRSREFTSFHRGPRRGLTGSMLYRYYPRVDFKSRSASGSIEGLIALGDR